jgi:outer membrane protein OmpA-like peptidoglycan-associated protein
MRNDRKALVAALVGAVLVLGPSTAAAQRKTFALDRLQPPGGPDDGIVMARPVTRPQWIAFGQLGVGYSVDPLKTRTILNPSLDRQLIRESRVGVVSHQLSTYLTVGTQFLNRFTASLTFPFGYVEGQNPDYSSSPLASNPAFSPVVVDSGNVGDFRLDLRGVVVRTNDDRGALGAGVSLFLPTGTQSGFGGDGSTGFLFGVSGDYDFGPIVASLSTGIHLRPKNSINDPVNDRGLGVADEWRWAAGAFVPIKSGRYRIGVNIMGQTGLVSGDSVVGDTIFKLRNTPIEWNAEGRMRFGPKDQLWAGLIAGTMITPAYGAPTFRVAAVVGFYLPILGSGAHAPDAKLDRRERWRAERGADSDHDGIPDDIDACPNDPEDHLGSDPSDGCPLPPDRDNDGVPDEYDRCPDQPEDKDGIDDGDGCPEDDADKDGIPDAQDACPKQPGQPNADPKRNGCPSFIQMDGSVVRILQQVHFATGSATILADSFPMLQEIANLLKANPAIKRMSIEGHTDNKGSADLNKKLSQARAESVLRWLTQHGVEPGRLEAHGYGPDRPIDTNDTDKGRAANRRVEFKILDQEDTNAVKKTR